jgi:hypothetical protein
MTRLIDLRVPFEQAYQRQVLFALELLDAVTLSRVSQGVTVAAEGLQRAPIVSAGGLFVWLREDIGPLRRVTVDPGVLPYERLALDAAEIQRPLTTRELAPRTTYPFAAGLTGLLGTVIEERVAPPGRPVPIADAEIRLRWLDEDGAWQDAPTVSHTGSNGDFVAIVRRARSQDPPPAVVPPALTVRVRVRRGPNERTSGNLLLPQGRVADPSTFASGPDALTFAWDELQP